MTNSTIEVLVERCMGAGNCVEIAPKYFDQDPMDGTVILMQAEITDGDEALVERAASVCPVAAILATSRPS